MSAAAVTYTTFGGTIVHEARGGVHRDYMRDPLGSTVGLIDSSQTVTDTFEYWPFGEIRTQTGSTGTPFHVRWDARIFPRPRLTVPICSGAVFSRRACTVAYPRPVMAEPALLPVRLWLPDSPQGCNRNGSLRGALPTLLVGRTRGVWLLLGLLRRGGKAARSSQATQHGNG